MAEEYGNLLYTRRFPYLLLLLLFLISKTFVLMKRCSLPMNPPILLTSGTGVFLVEFLPSPRIKILLLLTLIPAFILCHWLLIIYGAPILLFRIHTSLCPSLPLKIFLLPKVSKRSISLLRIGDCLTL